MNGNRAGQPKRLYARAFVVFGVLLCGLGIVGLSRPVDSLTWGFWGLLAVVVGGLLGSLILHLFRTPGQ